MTLYFILFATLLATSGIMAGFALASICAPYQGHKGRLPEHIWNAIFFVTFIAAMPTLLAFLFFAKDGGIRVIIFMAIIFILTASPFAFLQRIKPGNAWSILGIIVAAIGIFATSFIGLVKFDEARRELYRQCRGDFRTVEACRDHVDAYWSLPEDL